MDLFVQVVASLLAALAVNATSKSLPEVMGMLHGAIFPFAGTAGFIFVPAAS
jgi:hypothetical protein